MLFVLNKNKIISYTVAASVVAVLFIFSTLLMPKSNVEIVPASTNTTNVIGNVISRNTIL